MVFWLYNTLFDDYLVHKCVIYIAYSSFSLVRYYYLKKTIEREP